jgi:putative membrane protein
MMTWGWGPGWWQGGIWFGGAMMLVMLVPIVALIAIIAAAFSRRSGGDERSVSLSILEQRYAKGDIERDEYLQKLRDLVHSQ